MRRYLFHGSGFLTQDEVLKALKQEFPDKDESEFELKVRCIARLHMCSAGS